MRPPSRNRGRRAVVGACTTVCGCLKLDCDQFELTDLQAGESFKRWQAAPNEVLLADRAYARCEAVGALLEQGVTVVVRSNGRSFPTVPRHIVS